MLLPYLGVDLCLLSMLIFILHFLIQNFSSIILVPARLGKYIEIFGIENPDHNKDGDFSYDRNQNVIVNEKKNKFTWAGISIMHTSVIKDL